MDEYGLTYIIGIQDPYSYGYVSYDNGYCNSVDMAKTFDTEKEATDYMNKIQSDWASKLYVLGV